MPQTAIKRIPYGISHYQTIPEDNCYYVDKTHFIPQIEKAPHFLFCIRPRRFGKSLWLSTLQHYYDVNLAEQFDYLFENTYIGKHPTDHRNSYLVIFLNFSMVNPAIDRVQHDFNDNTNAVIEHFLRRYDRFFEQAEKEDILAIDQATERLRRIFLYATEKDLNIYLLIDEYDNFANTILTTEGQQAYHDLTHGGGFFRHFFNLLKGVTGGQITGLSRLYITGVSPITMDDVTSGFNIGDNISLEPQFNELIGFTEDEVRAALTYYRDVGQLTLDIDLAMEVMSIWYDHYRFAKETQTKLFNSTSVFHFIKQAIRRQKIPDRLIDRNLRIDYGKLRYLLVLEKQLNGNFDLLKSIIDTGEAISEIAESFPLEQLLDRENFISQLYYFGLLTFAGEREGEPLLQIPNRTIRDLLYGYIRDGFRDVDIFRVDLYQFSALMRGMAYRGEWEPLFDFLAEEIQKQTAIRDFLGGEKVIQGFLLAYLNISHFFLIWSEQDMGKGFVDLYLEPFLARYPDMKYGYLIELEYIQRGQLTDKRLKKEIAEAEKQLKQYASDHRIQKIAAQVPIKKLVLVYNGWELIYKAEWDESTENDKKELTT